jgi:hypothetical protein
LLKPVKTVTPFTTNLSETSKPEAVQLLLELMETEPYLPAGIVTLPEAVTLGWSLRFPFEVQLPSTAHPVSQPPVVIPLVISEPSLKDCAARKMGKKKVQMAIGRGSAFIFFAKLSLNLYLSIISALSKGYLF